MQRTPEIMRAILADVEAKPRRVVAEPGLTNGRALLQGGYVEGRVVYGSGVQLELDRLTWRGAELLDAIRSPEQWSVVEARFAGKSAPFELYEAVALDLAAAAAGITRTADTTASGAV